MASKTTTDHEEIRRWVEARGGCPAHVTSTGKKGDPGVLRIDYEGYSGVDTLESIDWDDWFAAFDENKLAFVYDTAKKSRFSKLISRETARRAATKRSASGRGTTAKKKASSSGRRTAPKKRTTTAKKRTAAPKKRATAPKKRAGAPKKRRATSRSAAR